MAASAYHDRQQAIAAARQALALLRTGTAEHAHWLALHGALAMGLAMEGYAHPLGISGHLLAGLEALRAIHARGEECAPSGPRPYAPCLGELDAIENALELHEMQMRQADSCTLALARDAVHAPTATALQRRPVPHQRSLFTS